MHVHVESDAHGHFSLDDELTRGGREVFQGRRHRHPTLGEIAAYYRERQMAAVVFTVDAHTATGHPALSSRGDRRAAAEHADVLIPFASVDPHAGADGRSLFERAAGGRGAGD